MSGLIVDLFAGGGGASTGIEWALGRSPDVGINHSWHALRNHHLNHPETDHVIDDVRDVIPLVVTGGEPVDLLWASPDCRHFSDAKGGKPCNPKVRALPWEITRWARDTHPRLICVENVPAMQKWGPLYEDHTCGCTSNAVLEEDEVAFEKCTTKRCHFSKPIPELAGTTWDEWIDAFRDEGYVVKWWILHAHHYGARTSRKRLFIVCRRDGIEPVCPEPTHGPGLLPYGRAADCIDWNDLGESIFDEDGNTRHAPATLRRIATGVVRYVVNAAKPFLIQTGYGERPGQTPRTYDVSAPHPTVVAGGVKTALVSAFLAKHYGGMVGHEPTRPLGTIGAQFRNHALVAANLIRTDNTSDNRLRGLADVREPLKTLTTATGQALVAAFLSTHYGQSVGQPADEPLLTQTTRHRHAVVTVEIDGVTYAIVDIRMRMLKPSELKLAQGFPASYRLEGTQRLQVALIGNSVPPQLAEAVVRANTPVHRTAGSRERARAS